MNPDETQVEPFEFTPDQITRMNQLRILRNQQREEKRAMNYHRPAKGVLHYANQIRKENEQANLALSSIMKHLITEYAADHNIDIKEIEERIVQDPTNLEEFHAQALEILPAYLHPTTLSNEQRWVHNNTKEGVPFVNPEKRRLQRSRKDRKIMRKDDAAWLRRNSR